MAADQLAMFKASVFEEVQAFVEESAAKYRAKVGGAKGNLTLFSFDGHFKVQVSNQDNINFDERLTVDDLIQEGRVGALEAAQRFDARQGKAFITYAAFWIKEAQFKALRLTSVHVPPRMMGSHSGPTSKRACG